METLTIESTTKTKTPLTPQLLAQAFWSMSDHDQADFFEALAEVIESDKDPKSVTYGMGEMQWSYMQLELQHRAREGNSKGLNMYHALSVYAFDIFQQHGLQQRFPH